jgi:Cu(I)/Ag(I) efflux system membrane fusion protein
MSLEPVYVEDAKAAAAAPSADAIHVSARQQQLIGLEYGIAEFAPASHTIRAAARVGVDESRVVHVQSKLEGFIDHLYVHSVGETVTQGQPLLSIFNRRTYSMPQMQFLQATMDASGMNAPATDLSNPNQKRLADAEALRTARQQLEMLGFTEDQIQAVSRAHQVLTSVPIHAPLSGVVIEFHAALNQKLDMEPLLTIADLSGVWVTADCLASDGASIRPGQSATLTVPYLPDRVFRGTVDTVLPKLDPETHSLQVRLRFANPSMLLKPEMAGELEFSAGTGARRLTVPTQAVLDSGRTQRVFVDLGGGFVEPREVHTGERFGDRIEILSGIRPGQRIVISGNFLLDSESRMRGGSQ